MKTFFIRTNKYRQIFVQMNVDFCSLIVNSSFVNVYVVPVIRFFLKTTKNLRNQIKPKLIIRFLMLIKYINEAIQEQMPKILMFVFIDEILFYEETSNHFLLLC